jgi:hypothetical protein
MQVVVSRGVAPTARLAQVPAGALGDAQLLQPPVQASAQQTPSTQKPLAQSPVPPQAVPFASWGTQWPAAQWLPAVQSLFVPHVVAHVVAPHMYAPHDEVAPGGWQVPAPSQARAGV